MVAPFATGGDAIARIFAEGWRSELGQPVIVETSAAPTTITGQWKSKSEFEARRVIRHCTRPLSDESNLVGHGP
jgi:hypothetical protein